MEREGRESTLVLVKALPHVGSKHGETVCCAGLTMDRQWRRLYPIHFRNLDTKFRRWQWIEYAWRLPSDDHRPESRRVQEKEIVAGSSMPKAERSEFLAGVIVQSTDEAAERGETLTLLRPENVRFSSKKKPQQQIQKESEAYKIAASQGSLFDKELAALEPCPYAFRFAYNTADGNKHTATCDDWETTAMFYKFRRQYGEEEALSMMRDTFNDKYPKRGVAFAMGTHSRRPKQWLRVGILRVDKPDQLVLDV